MSGGQLMIVLIVTIAVIGGVIKARFRSGHTYEPMPVPDQAENQRLREELKAMKDRLAVLERLATDSNTSSARLDREIEQLRDRP